MLEKQIGNYLTTIQTLSDYALESCHEWEPEDNTNVMAEAFLLVISLMTDEARLMLSLAKEGA